MSVTNAWTDTNLTDTSGSGKHKWEPWEFIRAGTDFRSHLIDHLTTMQVLEVQLSIEFSVSEVHPASTQRFYNIASTSMQRHDVIFPLGTFLPLNVHPMHFRPNYYDGLTSFRRCICFLKFY